MPAKVTTLEREIVKEERAVGMPTGEPLTDRAILHRRLQVGVLFCTCGLVALLAVVAAASVIEMASVALAGAVGVYAIEQDRHLHRLASLRGDSLRIRLVVAGELLYSGALTGDRELLDLRDRVGRSAGALAAALSDVLPADCARVRLVGPSGELPVAAQREIAPRRPVVDDRSTATEAMRTSAPVRRNANGHTTMTVPMWRGDDAIGLLEVISPRGDLYKPVDTALVDAFARGAVAALRSS